MAFRQANFDALPNFNSSLTCKLCEDYEKFVELQIIDSKDGPSHKTFSPSSFRCKRKQWFRLRGCELDKIIKPDKTLNFTAEIGTARHKVIQSNLKQMFGDDWISVEDYLKDVNLKHKYILTKSDDGLETLVEFIDIPVRFAVDGILKIGGKYYLLEIKTCEHSVFLELSEPKSIHIEQTLCYSALLELNDVIMIYEDRMYGNRKYYQVTHNLSSQLEIFKTMKSIQNMVDNNLAPERLPKGDYMCNNCEYSKKCKEWG